MKKIFLSIVISLIILLSAVLTFHIISTDNESLDQSYEQPDPTVEISTEIENLLLEEQSEIDIGEMI